MNYNRICVTDGDMGEELGFHPIVDPYKRELDFRVKRATPPEDTTSQNNQVIVSFFPLKQNERLAVFKTLNFFLY